MKLELQQKDAEISELKKNIKLSRAREAESDQ